MKTKKAKMILPVLLAIGALVLAGCKGIPAPGEKQARRDIKTVEKRLTVNRAVLPELTADSSLSNYLAFALMNSPSVQAAYYDWSASVEDITIQRSLPDPQITFQADIANIVMSVMPGFMQEFPGPGKLKARARAAIAESRGKYFAFESAALKTAFNLKRAYYQLGLAEEQIRLKSEMLSLLENQERAVRAQNATGASSLPELLRVQSDADHVHNEIADLEDSRAPLLQNLKAALGLMAEQADPPVPSHFEISDENFNADELQHFAFTHNPQLAAMDAEVRAAEADIAVAYKSRVPDFSLGLMADVKASPTVFRPLAGMTLPVWRDKIAAEIAQAKANDLAAKSRLKSAQIELATDFAEKSFAYRQTSRNLALIEGDFIPKANQSLSIVRAGYRTGTMDFLAMTKAKQMLLDLQLEAAEARTAREIALADLSLLVAGVPPTNAPFLANNSQP